MTQGGYRVAANMGKDGAASYTVVSPNGETMVMQPTEWAYFSQMTSGQQATIFAGSQWQLDLTSATEYGLAGNTTAAMANYAHMLAQPDYWIGMGAAFLPAGVLGRVATSTDEAALLGREMAQGANKTGGVATNGIAVPDDLQKNIHSGAQDKHKLGANNYDPTRSTLTADPQMLLDGVHSGQYPIVREIPRGNTTSYIIDFGSPIGDFKSNGTLVGPTQYGQVVQGKNGVHIIPANPNQF